MWIFFFCKFIQEIDTDLCARRCYLALTTQADNIWANIICSMKYVRNFMKSNFYKLAPKAFSKFAINRNWKNQVNKICVLKIVLINLDKSLDNL